MLKEGRLSTSFFADLFGGESASASAAAPMSERVYHIPRSRLVVWTFGEHQLATALGTLSLDHIFSEAKTSSPLTDSMAFRLERASFLRR